MPAIVKGFLNVKSYNAALESDPESLQPESCIYCNYSSLNKHGHYTRCLTRKDKDKSLNAIITIIRIICCLCKRTFGLLPEFVSPMRWYLWCMQQTIISKLFKGESKSALSREFKLSRDTIYRWWSWFVNNEDRYRKVLYSLQATKDYHSDRNIFWPSRFGVVGLSHDMVQIHFSGIAIPCIDRRCIPLQGEY